MAIFGEAELFINNSMIFDTQNTFHCGFLTASLPPYLSRVFRLGILQDL